MWTHPFFKYPFQARIRARCPSFYSGTEVGSRSLWVHRFFFSGYSRCEHNNILCRYPGTGSRALSVNSPWLVPNRLSLSLLSGVRRKRYAKTTENESETNPKLAHEHGFGVDSLATSTWWTFSDRLPIGLSDHIHKLMYLDSYSFTTSFSALTVCSQCYYRNYWTKMDAGQLRLVWLTLLLPEEAKVKTPQKFSNINL